MKKPVKKLVKKEFRYDQQTAATKYLEFKDMAIALEYGSLPAEQRVQLKMPKEVVDALDEAYPDVPRSKLITQMALELLQRKYRYNDDPDLELWVDAEQEDLDRMWDYLEERDALK